MQCEVAAVSVAVSSTTPHAWSVKIESVAEHVLVLVLVLVIQAVVLMNQLAIHRRLDGLPARAAARFKLEAEDRARADASAAHDAAKQMAAPLLEGLGRVHDPIVVGLGRQIADADLRARVTDRNATAATNALQTATVLVRELRTALDALGEARAFVGARERVRRSISGRQGVRGLAELCGVAGD